MSELVGWLVGWRVKELVGGGGTLVGWVGGWLVSERVRLVVWLVG